MYTVILGYDFLLSNWLLVKVKADKISISEIKHATSTRMKYSTRKSLYLMGQVVPRDRRISIICRCDVENT